jgi:quercetin 2,3-dioxygenase
LNLPAKLKMTEPRYRGVSFSQVPEVVWPDGTLVCVIAGNVDGQVGAITAVFADPTYLDVTLPAGCHIEQPVIRGDTALLYVFDGAVVVGGESAAQEPPISATRLAILTDGDLVSAQPLNEPAVRWGPFVMNTREEIAQALHEL